MKTLRRLGVVTASLLVFAAMAGLVGKAAVTFTAPNSATINYTLAPGATSSAITPATNQPVILIGSNTDSTNFSVSNITLVHIPSTMIRWVGLESAPSSTVIHGGSTTPGTHVVYLDNLHKVDVEIFSTDQVVIHNANTVSETGSLKLIW